MRKNKNKPQPILHQVSIEAIAAEGKSLAKFEDKVIFVEGKVAPGDCVDLRIVKKKKNYLEAVPIHIHTYSALRVEPFCQHFGICGGCKWQHINYASQLAYKQQQVIDSLERIAKVKIPPILTILASKETTHYRNKLEYTFSNNCWLTTEQIAAGTSNAQNVLGFHVPKRFDKIVDIETCYLQPEPSNAIRLALKAYAIVNNLTFFDLKVQQGFLRNLIIRTASTGDIMAIVLFFYEDKAAIKGVMTHLQEKFPQITSLQYVVNPKQNETFQDLEVITFAGESYITEEMEGLKFRIGPKSFYQTNANQAYELYKITRDFADLKGDEIVYDLYTGTGTIANFIAKQAKKVVGLEYVAMAIEDAKINAQINQINNTSFFAGDIKDLLTASFLAENGKPDVIITDPPRAGMHTDVINMILEAAPQKIVYVSCNPATQARDIALLDAQYEVVAIQPVDMFPHTHHVENVVKLIKR